MKYFIWSIIIIVSATIIAGFFVVGSPAQERLRKFDEARVNDLQNLQWQIVNYWQSKGELPKIIADLHDPIRGTRVPKDPETNMDYEYAVNGAMQFSLCAIFQREDLNPLNAERFPMPTKATYGDLSSSDWAHQAGRACFDRTIDPELYPRIK